MAESIGYYLKTLIQILGIILAFTAGDYLIHSLSPSFSVPDYYFSHKVIFGFVIGGILYFFINKMELVKRAAVFSAVISVLLQLNYLYLGYPLWFVFLFLGVHSIILFGVSYVCFKYML